MFFANCSIMGSGFRPDPDPKLTGNAGKEIRNRIPRKYTKNKIQIACVIKRNGHNFINTALDCSSSF